MKTSPLAKAITTLEGQLVIVANLALLVVPIVTTSLPPEVAAKYAVILNSVFAVSRALVKAFANPTLDHTPDPIPTAKGAKQAAMQDYLNLVMQKPSSELPSDGEVSDTSEYADVPTEAEAV